MAQLATRKATFDAAVTSLQTLANNIQTDVVGADSESKDLTYLRTRVLNGLNAMGFQVKQWHI